MLVVSLSGYGRSMAVPLALRGRIVTMDARRRVLDDGIVWIGADERIAAVTTAKARSPTGLKDAIMVETGGVVYPGLIDLHGHMVYNALSLWAPPGQTVPFASRGQWPRHPSYEGMVSDPANALGALAGKALLKYVEVKAVIGGTTAVQGSTKMAHPYDGWLVRNVEFETFGGAKKKSVFQDVRPPSKTTFPTGHKRLAGGGAWLFHTAEGTDPALRSEYEGLRDGNCLLPGLGAIHCTALTDDDFKQWGKDRGAVIWSPFSNLWLYRDTTKIDAAKRRGLLICLGSDWSPSGSKHLLAELKVADLWTKRHLPSGTFSDRDLCAMVTINPAAALRWSDRLGALRKAATATCW